MARRVFFHIGAPKTGTTFLQSVMWHNREELRRQGVLYPGRYSRQHLHASQVVRGNRGPQWAAERGESWDRLVAELAEWPETGLISHEFFGMASAEQAAVALHQLAPAEVHLVLTARDYVRALGADWQESLKMKLDLSLDTFVDSALRHELPKPWGWNSHDVAATLQRWGRGLPSSHVHVITVPPPGAPRDLLWRRWCEVLELDPDAFNTDVAFENQSLGVTQAELLRRVKPHLPAPLRPGPEMHRWVRGYFAHRVLLDQKGERFSLRPHHLDLLRQASEEAVASIKASGYAVTGDLAELLPQQGGASSPHPDDITDAELLDVAASAIARMVLDVRSLTRQRDRLRAQLGRTRRGSWLPPGSASRAADRLPTSVRRVGARALAALRRMRPTRK